MKKNKLGLGILLLGAAGFTACLANGEVSYIPSELLLQNTEFLVSLGGNSISKSEEQLKQDRAKFLANLNSLIGKENYSVTQTFENINVLKIKANEAFESTIASISGVKRVSINQTYRFSDFNNNQLSQAEKDEGYVLKEVEGQDATDSTSTDNTNVSAQNMNVPEDNSGGAGTFVAILDSGFYLKHNYFANIAPEYRDIAEARFSYEDLKSVSSKLIAQPAKTLDAVTTDYQATDRADGSLYWNLKVPFYYDYGASSQNSANDFDVLSTWSEHGTHVASITGANGTYDGIAPNAQLALMKVFYESIPSDTTTAGGVYASDDDILEALEDCVVLGIDSLNMSLGSDLDDFSDKSTSMQVINDLQEAGVNCNIAAGNAGKSLFNSMGVYKNWSLDNVDTGVLGSYSNSTVANVIASNTTAKQYYETGIRIDNGTISSVIAYQDQVDYTNGSDGITEQDEKLLADWVENAELILPVPETGNNYYGTDSDYSRGENVDPDLYKGKIAVVDRGSNSFVDKANAAADHGCAGLIVINNDPTAYEFNFGMSWSSGDANNSYDIPDIPVVFVLYRDRDTLLNQFLTEEIKDENNNLVAKVAKASSSATIIEDSLEENPNKDELSDFSSEGPTYDLTLNPTISAPGTSIRGATLGEANSQGQVPESDLNPDSVGYLNGTSMATPNYTGIVSLLLGEKQAESLETNEGLLTKEERLAYLKTIAMRTMSTADQYVSTNDIYDEIDIQDAVTDDEYETPVKIYLPVDAETNTAKYSPRKQGAGVVNASDAINSNVYLEGLIPDEKTGEYGEEAEHKGNNYAKIELRNNELVKKGDLKLGFRLHNEGSETKQYKVKLEVMTSAVSGYHNHDNEMANYVAEDAKYEGVKMQTAYDKLIDTVEFDKTLTVEADSTADYVLDHTISDSAKEYLSQFPNGMFVEGYLTFTEVGVSEGEAIELTMPYLGFYSDYDQADATEPFDFEKDKEYDIENGVTDGTIYGSDIVNYVAANSYSKSFTNMSSTIVGDSLANYNEYNRRSNVQVNNSSPQSFGQELTYKKDENGKVTLYVGSDTTDVLYVQEFVLRSIESEIVEIYDETGNAVVSKNVTDILTNSTGLYKSQINASYMSDYSLAHRGFAEIPLYFTQSNQISTKIPDGNYKLRFTYNLVSGATQTKEYNLVIDSKAPQLVAKSIITDASGNKTLRLKFNEIYIPEASRISVNSGLLLNFTFEQTSDGYIVDIPLNENTYRNGKLRVQVNDANNNSTLIMINESEIERGLFIEDPALTGSTNYTYTVTEEANSESYNINDVYEVSVTNSRGEVDIGSFRVTITYDRKINASVRVYTYDSSNNRTVVDNVDLLDDTTISFVTTSKKFAIVDRGGNNDSFDITANATVTLPTSVEGGEVYVDKNAGRTGDVVVLYAIPNEGYRIGTVKVNGQDIAYDSYGNYQFILTSGENIVEVTFVAIQ